MKAKEGKFFLEGGMRYLEVKQILLLAYCQAITFYLLLKSEGQLIRDRPVLGLIVEIQGLLDKVIILEKWILFSSYEFILCCTHMHDFAGKVACFSWLSNFIVFIGLYVQQ